LKNNRLKATVENIFFFCAFLLLYAFKALHIKLYHKLDYHYCYYYYDTEQAASGK